MLTPQETTVETQETRSLQQGAHTNVGMAERWASVIGGGALTLYGLKRGQLDGTLLALLGGALLYRGVTGHSYLYQALGIDTAGRNRKPLVSVPYNQGIRVEKAVTINRSPEEMYRFWRNFENLPGFMHHLKAVTQLSDKQTHWVAKGPAGTSVEWDAEIINDQENEWIAWRSLPNADVDHAGSVHFRRAPGGRGTEVKVEMEYRPPAGRVGAAVASLFGEEPSQQMEEDLHRLKQWMEAGEIPTSHGQPVGLR